MTTPPNPSRRAILGGALATAMASMTPADPAIAADLVSLTVINRNTGQALPVWRYQGRLFIAGQPGARYGLRVTNRTGRRVMAVLSVDGVNILTGETASYDQWGYIFEANESYDLNGWRKSDRTIAAFAFAPLPQSYAARTGRPDDVGVIGMAVFYEKRPIVSDRKRSTAVPPRPPVMQPREVPMLSDIPLPPPLPVPPAARAVAPEPPPRAELSAPSPYFPSRPQPGEKLGTAHGEIEYDAVTTESFERASAYPQFTYRLEYDSRANLVAAGVIPPQPTPPGPRRPNPFPAQPGYVPDPPPWP